MRPGTVVCSGERRVPCLIVDLGVGGARLQLFSRPLPEEGLTLIDRSACSVHELRVIWRRGPLMGVAFAGTAQIT